MEVTSASLGLRLSFRWQPYVDDEVLNKVRQWTAEFTYDNTTRPSSLLLLSILLLGSSVINNDDSDDSAIKPASPFFNYSHLGMAVWHMLDVERRPKPDHRLYNKHLRELAPSLAQLSQVTRVIWLNQYPPLEYYSNVSTTYITPEKINIYNKAVRRILLPEWVMSLIEIVLMIQ